jgi:hypothetical protein
MKFSGHHEMSDFKILAEFRNSTRFITEPYTLGPLCQKEGGDLSVSFLSVRQSAHAASPAAARRRRTPSHCTRVPGKTSLTVSGNSREYPVICIVLSVLLLRAILVV